MPTLRIDGIQRLPDGRIVVATGKQEIEFANVAALRAYVDDAETRELALKLVLGYWLRRNPAGTNVALLVGKTITLDLSAATPVTVE